MQYEYKEGKIYQDGNEIFSVKVNQGAMGTQSLEITGIQNIYIDKASGGYKITQNDMELGTISRNLKMNYNGRNYSITKPLNEGTSQSSSLLSDGTKVGTITFSSQSLTGTYDYMNDEVPLVIYLALLSPYIKTMSSQATPGQQGNRTNRANNYRMSKSYLILSNLVFIIAIVVIFASNYLHIPIYLDYSIIIIAIGASYGIRILGRKKYREKMQEQNDMNNNNNL